MRVSIILAGFLLLFTATLEANNFHPENAIKQDTLPKVFLLGDHEEAYNKTMSKYNTTLLDVCNDNVDVAFDKWIEVAQNMELTAQVEGINLNGVKLLLYVLWNEDGSISHLGYYLQSNSRNINNEKLVAFLEVFISSYKIQLDANERYYHYARASFPLICKKKSNENPTVKKKEQERDSKPVKKKD